MTNTGLPQKLQQNISVQQVGLETLVYDETRHKAFCLNRTSAAVWRLCDGAHSVASIAAAATLELQAPVGEEVVRFALTELRRDGLLEVETLPATLPAVSRRTLMRTLGASAVVLLPAVAVIMTPTAAQAYNGCFNCAATPKSKAVVDAQIKGRTEQADPWHMNPNANQWKAKSE